MLALAGVSTNASAVGNSSNSNTVSATLPGSVAIRLLDSTATTEISSLDFNLTPTASGTSSTQSMVVDVATSNPTGYKLYMQSDYKDSNNNYTNSLVHTTNHIPDSDIADTIPTYVPGSGSGSGTNTLYWNYINPLLNDSNNGGSNSNPTPSVIPAHGSPDKLDQYFTTTNSRQTEVSFNVSVDTTIVSGTYENQLLFSAVGNATSLNYTVSFNTNGGTMSGEDIEETAGAWVHSVTVPGSPSETDYTNYIPSKADSLFTGWTISIPTGSTATASCNGTNICHPGDSLNITAGTTAAGDIVGDVVLTAQYTSISTMQAMTPTICDAAAIGASTTLTDTRDSNTYTIRKLKDGNCWMTQNLDFLPTAGTNISSATSNVALTTTLQNTDSSKGNYLTDDCSDANIDKYCIAYSNNAEHPEYGTYYNWYAATSGTGTSTMVSPDRASSSICPKGWRLPTGGEGGEFQVLYSNYNSYTAMTDPSGPHFVLSDAQRGTETGKYQGLYGVYWSNSPHASDTNAYNLNLNAPDETVYPSISNYKRYGFTLRCLAHDNSYSILGVDPNGGTWSGSTSGQTFTQAPETTQSISNPSTNASYTISYDMGSTGITPPTSPTSAERSFTGWALSGAGTMTNGTYTYSVGNGLLTAQYNSTSNSFNLPTLSKSGYNCAWHQGSASGTVKQNNVTITGDTTFYAVCEPTSRTIATATYMQEVTECPSTLTTGAQYTLIDRGETSKSYTTSKLADGKCWMTQNYNRSAGSLSSTYYNIGSGRSYSVPSSNCTTSSWSSDSGNYYCNNSTYGGYYSYYAATAGASPSSGASSYDICPKGWRLPTQTEYNTLIITYSASSAGSKLVKAPVNMKYGGGCSSSGCPYNSVSYGFYWSSTAASSSNAYPLEFKSSSARTSGYNKRYGLSVRCVFGS